MQVSFDLTAPRLSIAQVQVREVLRLRLEKGFAVQSCVAFNNITSDGGTQAAQVMGSM